jgi:hypothetical protein
MPNPVLESDIESKRSFDEKSDEAFGAELGIFLKFLKVVVSLKENM